MDFVESKFIYKNHVLDLIIMNENMSKKNPRKPKKCKNEKVALKKFLRRKLFGKLFLNIFFLKKKRQI